MYIYPFIFTSHCRKRITKSVERMFILPFLCIKTLNIKTQNPLDTDFISNTQKLFISAQNIPQEACLPQTEKCCAMLSVLSLSKLVHLPSSEQLRDCQRVRRHRALLRAGMPWVCCAARPWLLPRCANTSAHLRWLLQQKISN